MDEQTVYGLKAVLALLEKRPDAVLRLFYRGDRIPVLKSIFAWLAARRMVYRELDEEGLRKVAGGPHHEGVVVVAQPLRYQAVPQTGPGPGGWLALDGVDNPHNLGAILRSAAFFGAAGVLVGGAKAEEKVNAAMLRVSEGGAEHLQLYGAPDLGAALTTLKANVPILGLETDARRPLAEAPREATFILAVGNEQTGLSATVRRACTSLVSIPGAGRVGSLNVSVATGIALAHLLPAAPPGR
jgi:TrmH RNA methyltransferase